MNQSSLYPYLGEVDFVLGKRGGIPISRVLTYPDCCIFTSIIWVNVDTLMLLGLGWGAFSRGGAFEQLAALRGRQAESSKKTSYSFFGDMSSCIQT
jgi:hypothetical protein